MTHLRKITLEELERRNYSETTMRAHLFTIEDFARYFHRPPDQLGPEHIREYVAHLFRDRKLKENSVIQRVGALRFFFIKTLRRSWNLEETPQSQETCPLAGYPEPRGSGPLDRVRGPSVSSHHLDDVVWYRATSRTHTPEALRYRQPAHGDPCPRGQGTERSLMGRGP